MSWCGSLWVHLIWTSLGFLDLGVVSFPRLRKFSVSISSSNFSAVSLSLLLGSLYLGVVSFPRLGKFPVSISSSNFSAVSLSPSGIPMLWMLVCLLLSHKLLSCRYFFSSFFGFLLLWVPLLCLWVHWSFFSHSCSLLLNPSGVVLSSVILFFSSVTSLWCFLYFLSLFSLCSSLPLLS